jgi:hypothetical protein
MNIYNFLTSLPAILGFTGFIIYIFWTKNRKSSPVLLNIIEIIKNKSKKLAKLDERMNSQQVYKIVKQNKNLQNLLNINDYKMLEKLSLREERTNYVAIATLLICFLSSIFIYFFITQDKTNIEILSVYSVYDGEKQKIMTTLDDIVITWKHEGNSEPLDIIIKDNKDKALNPIKVNTYDDKVKIKSDDIKTLWQNPQINDEYIIYILIQYKNKSKQFGPYKILTGLTILYYCEQNKVKVASMTSNMNLVDQNFKAKFVAWSIKPTKNPDDMVQSIEIMAEGGKGEGVFPKGFIFESSKLKCLYMGNYPLDLIRYENLY